MTAAAASATIRNSYQGSVNTGNLQILLQNMHLKIW